MYIYHKQCEIMQKIQWKSSNGQNHCFYNGKSALWCWKHGKIRNTGKTKTQITRNFQILYPIQGACFTNVDKFVTITSACRCLLHMHAGVYDTCTQVSMILACRCLLHLLACHHSSEGNSDRHAVVYDTCTQVSMTTARRYLWHLHIDPHNTHFHDY